MDILARPIVATELRGGRCGSGYRTWRS